MANSPFSRFASRWLDWDSVDPRTGGNYDFDMEMPAPAPRVRASRAKPATGGVHHKLKHFSKNMSKHKKHVGSGKLAAVYNRARQTKHGHGPIINRPAAQRILHGHFEELICRKEHAAPRCSQETTTSRWHGSGFNRGCSQETPSSRRRSQETSDR